MLRNKHITSTIRVDDYQNDISIMRLKRGDAPAPQHVEEIPLLVKNEPYKLE